MSNELTGTGTSSDNLAAEEPIPNPGLPSHTWRPTDIDEDAARRAERQIATMYLLSMVCVVLFCVTYFVADVGDNWTTFLGLGASTVGLGVFLGLALRKLARPWTSPSSISAKPPASSRSAGLTPST